MKDFAGNEFNVGDIIVCKPSSRNSEMCFGYIKKVNENTLKVVSWSKRGLWKAPYELVESNYYPDSVYRVRAAGLVQSVLRGAYTYIKPRPFPNGFPEELQQSYKEAFIWEEK